MSAWYDAKMARFHLRSEGSLVAGGGGGYQQTVFKFLKQSI
jgi:hypothetical protein